MNLSTQYICSSFKRLNQALKALNNEIIVLDFSHFSPEGINNNYDIYFKFLTDKIDYKEAYSKYIKGAIENPNSIWRKYKSGKRLIYNFENNNREANGKKNILKPEIVEKENEKIETNFDAYKHLIKGFAEASKLPGRCFIIYAENHGDAQSIVYVLLKNKIGAVQKIDLLKNGLPDGFTAFDKELHSLLIHEMVENLVEEKAYFFEQTKLTATKAAISEIINRNMAHHLTSHVSNRVTIDKVLERLGKSHSSLQDIEFYEAILDLLNRFNQYRDERSEYLTYITNFSSPSSAYFFQEVIRSFVENTLLMDNIAANENINYVENANGNLATNKLQLKIKLEASDGNYENFYGTYYQVNDKTETKLYCSDDLPYLRLKNDKREYPYDKFELSHQDIEVSLPGTLGKHALYSILENFIRNSAKHGGSDKNNGLEIILLLSAKNENFINLILADNCSAVTVERIIEFNNSIKTDILQRRDLGLIDMKVNACLLAGMELNDENCKKALTADFYKGKLAYKFKIAKPKKAIFIGDFTKGKNNSNGFYYFQTIEEYSQSEISKSFEFAVLSDDLFGQHKAAVTYELPARVLKLSEIDLNKAENTEHLYEAWLKKLRGDEKTNIYLFFEQDSNTSPTKEFKAQYENHPNLKVCSNEDLNCGLAINNERNILFDRHGGLIGQLLKDRSFVDTNHSWILIDKNNPDFDYISRYDIENKSLLLPYELEEAGLLKVLVIDERAAEQSVRKINETDQACKLNEDKRADFWKWGKQNSSFNLTLFDVAWAANIFLATHLNNAPLKQEISEQNEHCLKVTFSNGKIELETNIPSNLACRKEGKWIDKSKNNAIVEPIMYKINIKPNVIIIHRTKLKDLLTANSNFVKSLLNENPGINLVVTTGSGTTHGIEGDYKILPFSTLNQLLLGKRIHKLQLSKTLLQITKNKV